MSQVLEERDHYLSSFERFEKNGAARGPSWAHRIRKAAIARFADLGFPTTRHEEWKYTRVAPMAKIPFQPAGYEPDRLAPGKLARAAFLQLPGCRLVFVNGRYRRELSSLRLLPEGMKAGSLVAILDADPEWVEPHLARHASYQDHAFVALNTAFLQDGAFVYVPKGTVVEEPIQLLFVSASPQEATVSHPRNLIVVDRDSQAVIIENYVSVENDVYFTNAVTEIVAGENAVIDHYKVQRESDQAFHVATLQARLDRSSNFSSHSIALGGALVRNDVNAVLDGEGIECILNGLYLVAGEQHVDNHTRIDHVKPHGTSRELYKGVLDGKASGVFNGKIFVHKAAQKTDAKQTNKNLLLSEEALIDTKPQLEIYADDVKCTHGSTIGQIDQDAMFYLRSRGMGSEAARSLLTYAFAGEILSRMKVEAIRSQLDHLLVTRLQKGSQAEETS
ncbi:MAG: Fe-S cluster assembly protein SufD [Acidobacteria bacterium]|nr:Fe-S cluster assembly protein SufD [Acidobacteriota bacterium]